MATKIASYFNSKTVLITGGTGFLGTALVYKLLKSCAGINRIYLLVREKDNASLPSRFEQFASDDIFAAVDLSKVKMLGGDIKKKNLGMSQATIDLIKDEVNVIVHLAANLNFKQPINVAIQSQVSATNDLLNIANDCKDLSCFMYVSTAFILVSTEQDQLEEKLYPQTIKPQTLIEMSYKYSQQQIMEKLNCSNGLNNYTFSKCASENLLAEPWSFPTGIFRPGVVVEAYTEPYRYWYKNPNGFIKLIETISNGFQPKAEYFNANMIPVDYTINCLLAAIVDTSENTALQIYNYSSHPDNPITIQGALDYFSDGLHVEFESYRSKLRKIADKPVMDERDERTLSMIVNSSKVVRALKVYTHQSNEVLGTNAMKLWNNLSEEDKRIFMFDLRTINWREFHAKRFKLSKL